MPIPKIIHQTAKDFDSLPQEIKDNIERMKAMNPGWEHRFYDDAQVLDYIGKNYGERVLRACRRINPRMGVVLADFFRYLVMYREGGVYLDIKSGLERPLDEVLLPDDQFLISQWRNGLGQPYATFGVFVDLVRIPGGEFQQWQIVAAPKHPFLARVIEEVVFNMENYDPEWHGGGKMGVMRVAGPICYTLSIAPMRRHYPHRLVDIEDLGFRYTIYDHPLHHMKEDHYSRIPEPVLQMSRQRPR